MSTPNKSDGPTRFGLVESLGVYASKRSFIGPKADGGYIGYDEYQQLAEKLSALEAENARLREACKQGLGELAGFNSASNKVENVRGILRAALGPKGEK